MMKYFNQNWMHGDITDEEVDAITASYFQHIDSIGAKLPMPIFALAKGISLHDGLIRRVTVNKPQQHVQLDLRCGDSPRGYFDIELSYLGVDFATLDLVLLAELARDSQTWLLYDEICLVGDGVFNHRANFFPTYKVFSIDFTWLDLSMKGQPDRFFTRESNPYQEIAP